MLYIADKGLEGWIMNIYIGPKELTDQAKLLKKGFQEQGVHTRLTRIRKGNPRFFSNEEEYDFYYVSDNYTKVNLKKMSEFFTSFLKYDVFVFHFCTTFFSGINPNSGKIPILNYLDLPILKAMGKKIVMISLGDDLRSRPRFVEECKEAGLAQHAKYLKKDWLPNSPGLSEINKKKAQIINRYADLIFARPNSAQLITRPYELIWICIDLDDVQFNIAEKNKPLLLHAPSVRYVKGTPYLEEAIDRLRKEGHQFEFVLCENLNNVEVRRLLGRSSILVDQLISPGYGLLALEGMATGNIVLGSAVPGYNGFSMDLPIITTTPDTIYDNLKKVLTNRRDWTDIMVKGREYVERYHDYRKTSKDMLEKIMQTFDMKKIMI